MMPIGPLMIEHRLIERMIEVLKQELSRLEKQGEPDPVFIETLVDFIRTYADRCHHGKEEDILFRDLKKKDLSPEHEQVMEELVQEHVQGRELTRRLVEAKRLYLEGDTEALWSIIEGMRSLVDFYPRHIEKEDRHFFMPIMKHFSQEEREALLREEYEFDRKLIHEKYEKVVVEAEQRLRSEKGK